MAHNSHKRDTDARRMPKAALVAGPLALFVTGSAVAIGVVSHDPATREVVATTDVSTSVSTSISHSRRDAVVSRSESRQDAAELQRAFDANQERVATLKAVKRAHVKRWTTAALNLWTTAGKDAKKVGLVEERKQVLVTGRHTAERVEIVSGAKSRWVTAGYLADEKPVVEPVVKTAERSAAPAEAPAVAASCTNGTSVPSGVSPNIVKVHEAVCAAFPEITTYGTFRGDGEHAQGLAVDIMVSGARGQEVADFVRANYSSLGVNYIIFSQHIWSVDRSSEGWRGMEDRGSTTANHYDHVHVTTY